MFDKMKNIGRRKLSISTVLIVLLVFMGSLVMMGHSTSMTDGYARTMWVKFIRPVRTSGTATNWLAIGEEARPANSGTSLYGLVDVSGATLTPIGFASALLSGATSDIPWPSDTTPSTPSSGATRGWTLTQDNMLKYSTFYFDAGSIPTGVSQYTDNCPNGSAAGTPSGSGSGGTVYIPSIVALMHNKEYKFINATGTGGTPFVLHRNATDSQFRNVGTGTTQAPSGNAAFIANSGATSIPDGMGDTVTVTAVFRPSEVSGYYVTGMYINGN